MTMIVNKRKQMLTDLNTRLRLLKSDINQMLACQKNGHRPDAKTVNALKESLEYCRHLKRTIKVNTSFQQLIQD